MHKRIIATALAGMTLVACSLYISGDPAEDTAEDHTSGYPDSDSGHGHGHHPRRDAGAGTDASPPPDSCCNFPDGGVVFPDGEPSSDGGVVFPDGEPSPDGGGVFPDGGRY